MKTSHLPILTLFLLLTLAFQAKSTILNVPDDFETIQGAIDESEDGDTVLVHPGEYVENINFGGRAITVASLILTTGNEAYIDSTIINGDENGSVVRFDHEEGENSILTGFTLTNGSGSQDIERDICGGGIHCLRASPTLKHLIIRGNSTEFGGGVFFQYSSPKLDFIGIYDNYASVSGGGLYCSRQGTEPVISNTIIHHNRSERWAGGVMCFLGARPIFERVTIADNTAGGNGGGLVSNTSTGLDDGNYISLMNSIFWANEPNQIAIGTQHVSGGDSIIFSFSDIADGRDAINPNGARLVWLNGNIDEDPQFVDPDEGDFHLTARSPCIDAGDPDSSEDPDGTRADMGAFPFFQGNLIEGYVLDAENDEPLDSTRVSSSFGVTTFTDTSGFWRISPARMFPFDITASLEGYIDSTLHEIQLEIFDTLEVTFGLLHSEFTPTEEEFATVLNTGDSTSFDFSICNMGNGLLNWQAKKRLAGEGGADPWELRRSIDASEVTGDERLQGVVFAEDRFYLCGANIVGRRDSTNMIWILNREGVLVDSFKQLGTGTYGMRDLAWDGELIWGSGESIVYGFTTEGDSITSFEGPYAPNSLIAWDSDREVLWVGRKTSNIMHAYNRDGEENEVLRLDQKGFRIYGLAYYADDPDNYNLYILNSPDNRTQIVHKMNSVTGDTMLVSILNPEGGGSPGGCFISNQYDPRSWVFMSIANDHDGDRIDLWQVEGNTSWMILEPVGGDVEAEASQDMVLSVFTEGLTIDFWEAELVFNHNAAGGETILPVNLTIEPSEVELAETIVPVEFGIADVYPNPFNSKVSIRFTVERSSKTVLKVWDLSGREVATLYNGVSAAGQYKVVWNAEELPSGIYLLHLESGTDTESVRVVLLK